MRNFTTDNIDITAAYPDVCVQAPVVLRHPVIEH